MGNMVSRIDKLIESNGLTKAKLAQKLGINRGTVYSWFMSSENRRGISDKLIAKMSQIFDVSEEYIKYGIGSGVENYYLHLENGEVKFTVADSTSKITELANKFKIKKDNIKTCYCFTEEMQAYISEGDVLHVDFTEDQTVFNGCYILVTSDGLAVRFVRKDVFTKSYIIKTPTEDIKIKEENWHELILHAYRILMIEHEM